VTEASSDVVSLTEEQFYNSCDGKEGACEMHDNSSVETNVEDEVDHDELLCKLQEDLVID